MSNVTRTQESPTSTLPPDTDVALYQGTFYAHAGSKVAPAGLVLVTGTENNHTFADISRTLPLPVITIGDTVAVTFVAHSTTAGGVTAKAANTSRTGLLLQNTSSDVALVRYGAGADPGGYSRALGPGEAWALTPLTSALISVVWLTGGIGDGGLMVTEIT